MPQAAGEYWSSAEWPRSPASSNTMTYGMSLRALRPCVWACSTKDKRERGLTWAWRQKAAQSCRSLFFCIIIYFLLANLLQHIDDSQDSQAYVKALQAMFTMHWSILRITFILFPFRWMLCIVIRKSMRPKAFVLVCLAQKRGRKHISLNIPDMWMDIHNLLKYWPQTWIRAGEERENCSRVNYTLHAVLRCVV